MPILESLHSRPLPRRPRAWAPSGARPFVVALSLALGLATTARAAEPLRWKFTKGETIHYSLVQNSENRMKSGTIESGSTVNQTSDVRWIVDDVSPDGVAKLTQIIDRVRVTLKAGDQPPFEFDSNDKDKAPEGLIAQQVTPVFKALAGFECTLTMDPQGKIKEVSIPPKTLEALKGSIQGPMSNLFSEDAMKNMIAQSSLVLPEQALKAGESWTDRSKLPVEQFGTIVTEKTYTLKDEAGASGEVQIDLNAKMNVEAGESRQFTLEIKEQKNEGRFTFDAAKGRIAGSHVEVRMVQLISAGANTSIEQTVENTMEMKLGDGAPAK